MSPDQGWSWPFICLSCRGAYPKEGFPHRCPVCGGVFELVASRRVDLSWESPTRRGLGRFHKTFPLPPGGRLVSLGEGATPLLSSRVGEIPVFFKCEHLNPTGSFKDRGAAVLVSALLAAGIREVVEDSSGNAGASLAAYCARAGLRARIFVPAYASGPKRAQIGAYGAEVILVDGPRSAASGAVEAEVAAGAVYASHAWLPHGLAGMATIAFEIVEQLGQAPGAVVVPVGQGSLLLGVHWGFQALMQAGAVERVPAMVAVQARACAPLWAIHTAGAAGLGWVSEGETMAEGIRILRPLRGDAVLEAVQASAGQIVAVDEADIRQGWNALARAGLYVEPTSAVVWPALEQVGGALPRPIVAVLTGSGFKAGGNPGES